MGATDFALPRGRFLQLGLGEASAFAMAGGVAWLWRRGVSEGRFTHCGLFAPALAGFGLEQACQLAALTNDGPLVTTNIGANPQRSIYGIANRLARPLAQRLSGRAVQLL